LIKKASGIERVIPDVVNALLVLENRATKFKSRLNVLSVTRPILDGRLNFCFEFESVTSADVPGVRSLRSSNYLN